MRIKVGGENSGGKREGRRARGASRGEGDSGVMELPEDWAAWMPAAADIAWLKKMASRIVRVAGTARCIIRYW